MGERAVLILVGFLLIGLASRQPPLIELSVLLLLAGGVSRAWAHWSLRNVDFQRQFSSPRASWGEEIELSVRVTNRKFLPLPWLEIDDEIPLKLEPIDFKVETSHIVGVALFSRNTSLRWYEQATWRYRVRCLHRGYHKVGPATLTSGDLFGLFRSSRRFESFDRLLVYPRVFALSRLRLPSRQPFGELKGAERIFEDPMRSAGTREYRPSDPLKRIDWKASARRMSLQVRVFEPTTTFQLIIFLNVSTLPYSWQGFQPDRLEAVVSTAASMATFGIDRGYSVGLYANGTVPDSRRGIRLPPGRDPGQLPLIMESLAMVTPYTYNSIETVLLREARHLPWGATVALITAMVNNDLLTAVARLRSFGARLVVLTLEPVPEAQRPPGVRMHTLAEITDFEGDSPLSGLEAS